VLKAIRDRNIWRVYWTILLLGMAYGLAVAVIAIHLDALGYRERAIGGLAAWFASGIVLLSIPAGKLVSRWGAKRTLVLALSGYAASVSIFPLLTSYAPIAAARFIDGACSACLWVSCETILLRRSDRTNKAQVMSVYAMAMAIGYILGPIAANLIAGAFPLRAAFFASGGIAAISASYVALRLEPDARDLAAAGAAKGPDGDDGAPRTPMLAILRRIKTSCFATFAYGYFEASVVLFLPLYLMHEKGIHREQTIAVPAFFAAGMLLFTNVAGRLGDRLGHLFLMRILASIGGAMVLGFVALGSFAPMAVAVFIAGATLASISPVSLALQGVVTEPRDYDRGNAVYNSFYAAGILLGPPISGLVFARWGGSTMLLHLAALWAAFVAFAILFAADDPASNRAGGRARELAGDPHSTPSLDA
jgi:predicted MFS family arabinose efflux permease